MARPGGILAAIASVLLCCAAALPRPAHAVVYYVGPGGNDSNAGTDPDFPWATIAKAAGTLAAGDTVYVRGGTYGERVVPAASGTPGSYITYSAYPGETPVIDGAGLTMPSWESGLFDITDRSYVKVTGFDVRNAGPYANNCGIYVDNSHFIVVANNHTYNTVSSGIGVWGGGNVTVEGNEVELACNDGEQECVTVAGTNVFEVRYNHVHHGGPGTNGGEGIDLKDGAQSGRVYGNHVHHTGGERTGIYMDAWDKATGGFEVSGNTVHDCGAGITLASEMGGNLANVKVHDNVVYRNRGNGLEIGSWGVEGVASHPVANVAFVNNTVAGNGTDGWGGGVWTDNADVSGWVVRNNIVSLNAAFQVMDEAGLPPAALAVDHNLIEGFVGDPGETRGTEWVEGDPLFFDSAAGDFRIHAASPARDAGSQALAPVEDFSGLPRPLGGYWDIGAHEFDPGAPGNDVVLDFGAGTGVWVNYNDSPSSWSRLHAASPESLAAGDIDNSRGHEAILDFGPGVGVWANYNDDPAAWSLLHGTSPELIAVGDLDGGYGHDVVYGFGAGLGVWVNYNDDPFLWRRIHALDPELIAVGDLDGAYGHEVILDFGPGAGVWANYNDDPAAWRQVHALSPELLVLGDLDGAYGHEVILDFGPGVGVWAGYNDDPAAWRLLHPASPGTMAVGDLDGSGGDDVLMDFGPALGLWVNYDGDTSRWRQVHASSPELIAVGDMDHAYGHEVILDLGASGVWVNYNDDPANWRQIHPSSPEAMAAGDFDGN